MTTPDQHITPEAGATLQSGDPLGCGAGHEPIVADLKSLIVTGVEAGDPS